MSWNSTEANEGNEELEIFGRRGRFVPFVFFGERFCPDAC